MGNIGASISRNRQQTETKNTYNPDLEPTQQGYGNAMYGPGAMIGSYGMSGGQFPTTGKDPAGFGSGGYGYPGQFPGSPNTTNPSGYGTAYPGSMSGGGSSVGRGAGAGAAVGAGLGPLGAAAGAAGGATIGAAWDAANAHGGGQYWGPGNTGQPGAGSLYYGGQGGGYQFGGQGGGSGYGGYSAMQPGYQFGSGGAQGDLNATGGAAYGGYSQLGRAYGRMGAQGVTGQERANLMAASNEAIQSNNAAYRDMVNNRAAQSGNMAGASGALARLGASSGQQLEAADRANQTAIMAENQRRKEAGLAGQAGVAAGQAGMYGTGAGYMSNLLGGRGRLASLKQRDYTSGAGTGGTVSYSSGQMG